MLHIARIAAAVALAIMVSQAGTVIDWSPAFALGLMAVSTVLGAWLLLQVGMGAALFLAGRERGE